ncbi:hypothetical protein [Paenibacillus sp. BC26]|uniref:hypothetical protein n=1 Tax=Paenibacillus sp. BC26 TaxID=1881032 RepID=UPI001C43395A|nr:hypothetical protein [Paenibacillus sp. BC26]
MHQNELQPMALAASSAFYMRGNGQRLQYRRLYKWCRIRAQYGLVALIGLDERLPVRHSAFNNGGINRYAS